MTSDKPLVLGMYQFEGPHGRAWNWIGGPPLRRNPMSRLQGRPVILEMWAKDRDEALVAGGFMQYSLQAQGIGPITVEAREIL
jgi:hypothetical protein